MLGSVLVLVMILTFLSIIDPQLISCLGIVVLVSVLVLVMILTFISIIDHHLISCLGTVVLGSVLVLVMILITEPIIYPHIISCLGIVVLGSVLVLVMILISEPIIDHHILSRYCSNFNNLFIYLSRHRSAWNVLVLVVILTSKSMRSSTNLFLLNLRNMTKSPIYFFYFFTFICVNGQMLHWSINEDKLLA